MLNNFEKLTLNLIILSLLALIFFTLQINYYGSDHDTYSIIYSFLSVIDYGEYFPSRTFGFPLAELIIGSLVYFFGPFTTKYVITFLFITSLFFFYKSFNKEKGEDLNFKLFLILCLSNSILILDNINLTDYPIALFFLSLGFFLYSKKKFNLALLFFSLCIASRLNFIAFIYIFYLFQIRFKLTEILKLLKSLFKITILGGIFYLPYLFKHNFSPELISKTHTLGGLRFETDQQLQFMFYEMASRFFYKIIKLFGLLSFILITFGLIFNLFINDYKKFIRNNSFEIIIIILNLFLFFLLPTKTSIISLVTIFTYIIIIKYFNKKILYAVIFFNLINFYVLIDFVKITYRYEEICLPKQAISAKFEFQLSIAQSNYKKYLKNSKNNMICSAKELPEIYRDKFLQQRKLSIND